MITIKPLTYNPFAVHDGFRDIWPQRDNAPEEDVLYYLEASPPEFKFLICLNDQPIGLTGYWPLTVDSMGMAWSGLIKSQQGKGYWPQAFKLVLDHMRAAYPEIKYAIEPMPQERVNELGPYYEKLGFVNMNVIMDHPELYDAVTWIEYRYTL
jgi:RimJ/RimL family protein N-acetyltransferase